MNQMDRPAPSRFTPLAATSRPDPHLALRRTIMRLFMAPIFGLAAMCLSGCQLVLMDPKGPIGLQEKDLIILAVLLMLIPVVPVIVMTLWFAWRYRASNAKATYAPDFEHSNRIEAVVWAVPTLIILALGAVTWVSTHELDPSVAIKSPVNAKTEAYQAVEPVEIEVVSLDWKWLFIYPQYNVASVNEMALPVGTPVHFRLTSATVMNSFFIPQLGSQIYTMPGMETKLNLRADQAGSYEGISANYSGEGFAGMTFKAVATDKAAFNAWIAKAKTSQASLNQASYAVLAQRGLSGATTFASTDPSLFHNVLNNCTDHKICKDMSVTMAALKDGKPVKADCKPAKTDKDDSKMAVETPVQLRPGTFNPRKS